MSAWPKVRLGDVCEILDSKRIPITKKDRTSGSIPYYGATGIVDYVGDYIFDERLVLLGEDGAKWGAGDNSAFIVEGKTWVNNHAHVLRPTSSLDDLYLVYYLNNADLSEYITGVTVPKLNQQKMCSISLPLPPITEQKKIVERLEKELSAVDKMAKGFEQLASEADATFKAELKEAFEGIAAEKVKLGDVCEIIAGQSPEGKYYTSDSSFTEFHQGSKNFGDWELNISGVYTKKVTKVVEAGTLLISVRAPVGDLNITKSRICIGRGLAALLPKENLSRDFLCFFLTSATKAVNDAAGVGTCFASISRVQLSALNLPLPPLAEQRKIVAQLDEAKAKSEKLKALASEGAKQCALLRKAVLKEAFE